VDFGVDSSRHFSFRAQRDKQTRKVTDENDHATHSATAKMGKDAFQQHVLIYSRTQTHQTTYDGTYSEIDTFSCPISD